MTACAGPEAGAGPGWRRLHPLSPVVRFSRSVIGLVIALAASTLAAGKDSSGSYLADLVLVSLALASGVVSWLVTRWQVEGTTLRVESGLFRRDSRQVPLSRVQAIDLIQPAVARILGLAELRLRVAGSRSEVRLAYLSQDDATTTRTRLLALAQGSARGAPVPAETGLVTVRTARLAAAVALSGTGITAIATTGLLTGLVVAYPGVLALIPPGAAVVIGLTAPALRQVSSEGGFSLTEAPDGLRVRCGLIEKLSETIPRGRVQAVRRVEPLLWRPFGWCRMEVLVAGSRGHPRRNEPAGRVVRALLPVGSRREADSIVARLLPDLQLVCRPPPGRARWKAPLSYHFLSAGHDRAHSLTTTGRIRRVTMWVPLGKVQSLRLVQGPLQRRLGLANVHLDVAGRRFNRATFQDRGITEATELVETLAELCRIARGTSGPDAPDQPCAYGPVSPQTPGADPGPVSPQTPGADPGLVSDPPGECPPG